MKFEEVLSAFREGKKITSKQLRDYGYLYIYYDNKSIFSDSGEFVHLPDGLLDVQIVEGDDWEIFDETKPRKIKLRYLTPKQYKKWDAENCKCGRIECRNCLFSRVECDTYHENVWYLHKDLFSDKFLDQEVEVED